MACRCGPCRRSRQGNCGRERRGAGRRTAGGVGPEATAPQSPTACPSQAHQQGSSCRGSCQTRPRGAKRRLRCHRGSLEPVLWLVRRPRAYRVRTACAVPVHLSAAGGLQGAPVQLDCRGSGGQFRGASGRCYDAARETDHSRDVRFITAHEALEPRHQMPPAPGNSLAPAEGSGGAGDVVCPDPSDLAQGRWSGVLIPPASPAIVGSPASRGRAGDAGWHPWSSLSPGQTRPTRPTIANSWSDTSDS